MESLSRRLHCMPRGFPSLIGVATALCADLFPAVQICPNFVGRRPDSRRTPNR